MVGAVGVMYDDDDDDNVLVVFGGGGSDDVEKLEFPVMGDVATVDDWDGPMVEKDF